MTSGSNVVALPLRCANCFARDNAICAGFADHEIAALNAIGRKRTVVPGQVVIWAGDANVVCANIVSGVLKVVRAGTDGREQIVGLLFPGDFVGQLFTDVSDESVVALGEAELCVYPREAFERVAADHQTVETVLLRRALAALAEARGWMLTLARKEAGEKVAALLLDMMRRMGANDCDAFDLPLGRGQMADVLGLRIETVSRQMTALQRAGVIGLPGGRRVTIVDRERLKAMALN